MNKYYYKRARHSTKRIWRLFSLLFFTLGIIITGYVFFPLISWQIYFAPIFANQNIAMPIPKTTVVTTGATLQSLISQASTLGVDYTNAQNWFPNFNPVSSKNQSQVSLYALSIPKLGIKNAVVSTQDNNLAAHLVNYGGTAVPSSKGNAVVFGHSTLPWLFNQNDYKTIFATVYKLKVGDEIYVGVLGVTYRYKIYNIIVIDPSETSVLSQDYSDSFLTLITCTPPGTVWKRLVIKARLEPV